MSTILVTGGTGYLGSHMIVSLVQAGHRVISIDNFANSYPQVNDALIQIIGRSFDFIQCDIRDIHTLEQVFGDHKIDGVIHFAAHKAVGQSMQDPLSYYHNNIGGTLNLLMIMEKYQVHDIVFSSSCTVYGDTDQQPLTESHPKRAYVSPYVWTKSINEDMLYGLSQTGRMRSCILRYFNPIGAHPSGLIGEYPIGTPANLLPYVMGTVSGVYPYVNIFGNDYPTTDGTALRDYIHIMDLVQAHMQALQRLDTQNLGIYDCFNIGTGKPSSVLDIIRITEHVTGRQIPYQICDRRYGDVVMAYADPHKAQTILGWKAQKTVTDAITDMRNFWQQSSQV